MTELNASGGSGTITLDEILVESLVICFRFISVLLSNLNLGERVCVAMESRNSNDQ